MTASCCALDPHSNYFSARNSEYTKHSDETWSYEGIGPPRCNWDRRLRPPFIDVIGRTARGRPAASWPPVIRITAVGEGKTGELTDVIGWRLVRVTEDTRAWRPPPCDCSCCRGAAPGSVPESRGLSRATGSSLEAQASHKALSTVVRNGKEIKVGIITVPSFYQDYDASRGRREGDYRKHHPEGTCSS